MLYRVYSPDDFTALYGVEEACFEPPFRFSRTYMREVVADPDSATWLAEENGAIVGFAIVEWSGAPKEAVAYIQTIEVLPVHRRSGIASELMRRLEGSAMRAGARLIWLHVDAENTAAIRLYEAHGFISRGREENYYPRGRAALIYAKRLSPSPSFA